MRIFKPAQLIITNALYKSLAYLDAKPPELVNATSDVLAECVARHMLRSLANEGSPAVLFKLLAVMDGPADHDQVHQRVKAVREAPGHEDVPVRSCRRAQLPGVRLGAADLGRHRLAVRRCRRGQLDLRALRNRPDENVEGAPPREEARAPARGRPSCRSGMAVRIPGPDAPEPARPTCSEILCIQPYSLPSTIRAAHRNLVVHVHPDRGGNTELMSRINAARDEALQQVGSH